MNSPRFRWIAGLALIAGLTLLACTTPTSRPGGEAPRAERTHEPAAALPSARWYDPGAIEREPDIRVRIARGIDEVTIGGAYEVTIRPEGDAPLVAARTPLRIARSESQWALTDHAGRMVPVARDAESLRITTADAMLEIDGMRLPGELVAHASGSTGGLDLVEHLALETYLPGVISKELVASWSPTAFEVQAICARSYALHERARRRSIGSHFDLEGTTQDQVYGGDTFNARARAAVRATRGRVLTYNNSLLRAYYSSTCGGRANSARDVWPIHTGFEFNLAAPIQASPRRGACEISPLYRWDVRRPMGETVERFNEWGRHNGHPRIRIDRIASIDVHDRNAHGRPRRYVVRGASGDRWTIEAEDLRNAFNQPVGETIPAPERASRVHSGDFEVSITGDELVITGRGFGHGVGMCQYGAEGHARAGWTAREILLHFYPGARLERLYP